MHSSVTILHQAQNNHFHIQQLKMKKNALYFLTGLLILSSVPTTCMVLIVIARLRVTINGIVLTVLGSWSFDTFAQY